MLGKCDAVHFEVGIGIWSHQLGYVQQSRLCALQTI
ncbi:hypothetical protein BVRB_6g145190 [Beta vulgaris subsp. vulgaris]|uniref:Uncharacterized protein n=1 Tax=Beta vulgaris subsp. vulgaris TaxID=3555 RepID=A0A0J8C2C5_BETVV|nr:hypothetical protein BVRB_6g145190 [Beta vulgaris subsp. vulgaris]